MKWNWNQKILDSYGGTVSIYKGGQTWPPWYADLVFRNATQAGLAGGRYAHMFNPEGIEEAPFVLYRALHDLRTRPTHAALDGKVFRKTDLVARKYMPPWEHNCRCFVRALTLDELQEGGYQLMDGAQISSLPLKDGGIVGEPPPGWNRDQVEALVPGVMRGLETPTTSAIPVDLPSESVDTRGLGKPKMPIPSDLPDLSGSAPRPPKPRPTPLDGVLATDEVKLRTIQSHEEVHGYDAGGTKILEKRGRASEDFVELTESERRLMANAFVVHNHPGAAESFSLFEEGRPADLKECIESDLAVLWAVGIAAAQPVRYVIQRPVGGWIGIEEKAELTTIFERNKLRRSSWYRTEHSRVMALPDDDRRRLEKEELDREFQHRLVLAVCGRLQIPYDRIFPE